MSIRTQPPARGPSRDRDAERARAPAADNPVARVCVDVPLAHLDRPFDYLVPESIDASVTVGSRVRVRFAGKSVGGFVLDRVGVSEHTGQLAFVEGSVSAEPVLAPEVAALTRAVADRYAGVQADVLRLAIPPRRAGVEGETPGAPGARLDVAPDPGHFAAYTAGTAFLRAVAAGRAARAVWTALPGEDWPARLAEVAGTALAAGRGALLVLPDQRDLDRLDTALLRTLGPDRHTCLSADLGATERYRRFLAVRRGLVRVVAGTRAVAFAPVADLGLVACWDDGDDLHAEPRAPYPHTRDVLAIRSRQSGAALLLGACGRSVEAAQLLRGGWAAELRADRSALRRAAPRVGVAGEDEDLARDEGARTARLPSAASQAARTALAAGAAVLVQVPRRGYAPLLACAACRSPARCRVCEGPLAAGAGGAAPVCRWCGRTATDWSCPRCGHRRLRASVVGARRTAEELGRAFPAVSLRTSGRGAVLAEVDPGPALVVCTPGAEPLVAGGYGAALLLDAWALLGRPDLRAGEEALRRWSNAVALVRPAAAGGTVVLVGADPGIPACQALIRSEPGWFADRELTERAELGLPPAVRMAELTGPGPAVAHLLEVASLPAGAQLLGPVPVDDARPVRGGAVPGDPGGGNRPVDRAGRADEPPRERMLVRVPRAEGAALAAALRAAAGVRSALKAPGAVRIVLDPQQVG